MLPKLIEGEKTGQMIAIVIEEGVRFVETSGRNPEASGPGALVLRRVLVVVTST